MDWSSGSDGLVCGWWWCWPRSTFIISFFFIFLSFISFPSYFLTFSAASQPIPTTTAIIISTPTTTTTTPAPLPISQISPSPSPSPTIIYLEKSRGDRGRKHSGGATTHHRTLILIISVLSPILITCFFIMAFLKYLKSKIRRRSKRIEDVDQDHHHHHHQKLPDRPDYNYYSSSGSKNNNKMMMIITNPICSSWVPKRFSWDEIERLTMNFTSTVIGEGGFSNVYLSHFSDSSLGALKIPSSTNSERLNRMFKQELEILLHLRHPNIVNLIGYCDEREESALVFEYVSNGSLHDKLHHKGGGGGGDGKAVVLPWKSRMSIVFQLAQAIEYLHDQCKPQIVHGDIKSSNILLDDQLNCKLCDFGFSKMGFSSTVTRSSSSSMNPLMGSPGYMDPLYLRTGIASKKNDVYSFGVIILEMITGMEAFCPEKEQLLTSVAGPIIGDADKVGEMVDPRLVAVGPGGDFGGVGLPLPLPLLEETKVMATIAGLCLRQQPSLRPSMAEILRTMSDKISLLL